MATLLGETRIDSQRRIQRFLNHPSAETWDDIHGILITPRVTIWQAVLAIDPSFPTVGRRRDELNRVIREWSAIPLPLTVMRAIREVVREGKRNG